tara:strand:- start:10900 stop:11607 length:708 start_codon:yes stop_codon:yes gene_type:complete
MKKVVKLKDLEIVDTSDKLYEGFNNFMLSQDLKVFGKLLARTQLFDQVKDLPGDIVECGVFKGTGLFTFLKLKRYLCPNSGKKVIGFDYFDTDSLLKSLSDHDQEAMRVLFDDRAFKHSDGYYKYLNEFVLSCGFQSHEFDLVKGDICKTSYNYCAEHPGFRISLLYIDLDVENPTYEALNALWDRVVQGGIVVFDEYGFHQWSEANGVDKFFEDKDIDLKSLDFICPSAYVVKK